VIDPARLPNNTRDHPCKFPPLPFPKSLIYIVNAASGPVHMPHETARKSAKPRNNIARAPVAALVASLQVVDLP
jgi:hypothetical protein